MMDFRTFLHSLAAFSRLCGAARRELAPVVVLAGARRPDMRRRVRDGAGAPACVVPFPSGNAWRRRPARQPVTGAQPERRGRLAP